MYFDIDAIKKSLKCILSHIYYNNVLCRIFIVVNKSNSYNKRYCD